MSPYREMPLTQDVKRSRWKRVWCWVVDHDWVITRGRWSCLVEIHPLAGKDAYCVRCGRIWLDYNNRHFFGTLRDIDELKRTIQAPETYEVDYNELRERHNGPHD